MSDYLVQGHPRIPRLPQTPALNWKLYQRTFPQVAPREARSSAAWRAPRMGQQGEPEESLRLILRWSYPQMASCPASAQEVQAERPWAPAMGSERLPGSPQQ